VLFCQPFKKPTTNQKTKKIKNQVTKKKKNKKKKKQDCTPQGGE
jgi:hypothetical protein